jgi:phage host-nuclease inhibitor protein Gam
MARTENQRPDNGRKLSPAAPPAPPARAADLAPAPPNDAAPESLDKVRDILFGGQMRAVESRLQGLEERIMREQSTMRSDFDKRLADVDTTAKRDIQTLNDRLAAERTKRAEDLKALSAELKELLRSLEKRHVKLEELSGLADAEIRDHILQQSRAIGAEIERLSQRVSADLAREVASLRNDKTDVSALVGVFSDMATRLAGESHPPAKPTRS